LNKYIDSAAPWTLYKNKDLHRLGTVIYVILEGMRKVALHLWPVMPSTSETMLAQLGLKFSLEGVDLEAERSSWFGLAPGTPVAERSNLFPRHDLEPRGEKAENFRNSKPVKEPMSGAHIGVACPECIEFEDFAKVDLRVGTVLEVTPHPEADRLLVLKIDLGDETPRQVVAGIAEFFKPEDLAGRQVVVVANLKPRKLRGLVSWGMVLAVKKEGGLALLGPSSGVIDGSKAS
jgi:methionyl-tRNA synthetase